MISKGVLLEEVVRWHDTPPVVVRLTNKAKRQIDQPDTLGRKRFVEIERQNRAVLRFTSSDLHASGESALAGHSRPRRRLWIPEDGFHRRLAVRRFSVVRTQVDGTPGRLVPEFLSQVRRSCGKSDPRYTAVSPFRSVARDSLRLLLFSSDECRLAKHGTHTEVVSRAGDFLFGTISTAFRRNQNNGEHDAW